MPLPMKSKTSPTANPFEALALTNNPFPGDPVIRPRSADRRVNGAIFADGCRKEVISRFDKLLLRGADFENRARMALLWSEGDTESGRGMGKTALLRHFQHRINHDWGTTEFKQFTDRRAKKVTLIGSSSQLGRSRNGPNEASAAGDRPQGKTPDATLPGPGTPGCASPRPCGDPSRLRPRG